MERPRKKNVGWEIWLLLFTVSAFRLFCLFRYRIDSDEPQHLHVAWGWAHGLVQYRDVFDNHLPLFHLLTAPIVRLSSESADLLTNMRLAVLPLGFLCIALTCALGWKLVGKRAGIRAAILLSACPPFLLKTAEFRNDTLWCALVLGALVALHGPPVWWRSALTGLLTGLAITTSVKTAVIGLAVTLALVTLKLEWRKRLTSPEAKLIFIGFCFVLVAPAILILYYWRLGALNDLVYGAARI